VRRSLGQRLEEGDDIGPPSRICYAVGLQPFMNGLEVLEVCGEGRGGNNKRLELGRIRDFNYSPEPLKQVCHTTALSVQGRPGQI
jgi:hypothetical protein